MKKVTPFLWYDDPQAEEAVNFYVSIFKNSKVLSVNRKPDGNAWTVSFELDGVEYMALNGGPMFKFTEAFSMYVNCEDQDEVDYFWSKLSAIPEAESCGWCKDKWGLSRGKLSELFAERYGSIAFWNASFPAGIGYIPM